MFLNEMGGVASFS